MEYFYARVIASLVAAETALGEARSFAAGAKDESLFKEITRQQEAIEGLVKKAAEKLLSSN